MPAEKSNQYATLSVSGSNFLWFDASRVTVGAIEVDANGATGWTVQIVRSARAADDVGYALEVGESFNASGMSRTIDLSAAARVGLKVTTPGTGTIKVWFIGKADY